MSNANIQTGGAMSCRMNVVGLSFGMVATLAGLFVICWAAAVLFPAYQLAHGWISLFSTAPVDSTKALLDGVMASAGFGLVSALIFAPVYNLFMR
jgi:hypothetical protein